MIREVAATIEPLAQRNGNTLDIQCPDNIGEMRSDLTKVRQALLNIMSNAAKFTRDGSVKLHVSREQARRRIGKPSISCASS